MSYVSEHALYGVGNYYAPTGLGAVISSSEWRKTSGGYLISKVGSSAATWFLAMKVQANRVAALKGFAKIPESKDIGPPTVELANKILAAYPMSTQPFSDIEDLAANARGYSEVFKALADSGGAVAGAAPPSITAAQYTSSFQPTTPGTPAPAAYVAAPGVTVLPTIAITGKAPKGETRAARKRREAAENAAAHKLFTDSAARDRYAAASQASFMGIPTKFLLIGGAAALVIWMMSRRKSSAPVAAVATPAIPKGV